MSYLVLSIDDIPLLEPEDVLESRNIFVLQAPNVLQAAEAYQGILVEIETVGEGKVAVAYIDFRPSKRYPRLRIGINAELHVQTSAGSESFELDCHVEGDDTRLGLRHLFSQYREAIKTMVSFIDYAGTFLDPNWFDQAAPALSSFALDEVSQHGKQQAGTISGRKAEQRQPASNGKRSQ